MIQKKCNNAWISIFFFIHDAEFRVGHLDLNLDGNITGLCYLFSYYPYSLQKGKIRFKMTSYMADIPSFTCHRPLFFLSLLL